MSRRAWRLTSAALLLSGACLASGVGAQGLPGAGTTVRGRPLVASPVTVITGGQTVFLSIDGSDISTTQAEVQTRLDAGTLRRARGYVSVAPGSGESVTLTAQTGACGTALADSPVVITISGTAFTADDLTNAVGVSDGECAVWKATLSGGAAATRPRALINFF